MSSTVVALPITLGKELDFDIDQAAAFGRQMTATYTAATPFPHVVIDDFLPSDVIDSIHANFPAEQTHDEKLYERGYKGLHKRQINPNRCNPYLRSVFAAFNSAAMLQFLESLTTIEGLIPDPYFDGGGLHETKAGGLLGVHADFRVNKKLHVVRRINVIIYLNKNWQEEYGGNLELWDPKMNTCLKRISPIYNRCVIFNTDKDSNHGHPEPLRTPEHISRRSIALYYYTSSGNICDEIERDKTHYKPRPKDRLSIKYYLDKWTRKKS